jgi:hypothetical protein
MSAETWVMTSQRDCSTVRILLIMFVTMITRGYGIITHLSNSKASVRWTGPSLRAESRPEYWQYHDKAQAVSAPACVKLRRKENFHNIN